MPSEYLLRMLHPRLFDLTSLVMAEGGATDSATGMPEKLPQLPLAEGSLQNGHVYLMDAGHSLLLYEHGSTNPEILSALFGADKLEKVPLCKIISSNSRESGIGCNILKVFIETAENSSMPTPRVLIIKDLRELLVGDHTHSYYSYHEFVSMLRQ